MKDLRSARPRLSSSLSEEEIPEPNPKDCLGKGSETDRMWRRIDPEMQKKKEDAE